MNRLSPICILLALCACADNTEQQLNEPATEAKGHELVVTPVPHVAESEFPSGFIPDFEYRVRSRKLDLVDGNRYRKLVIEYKGIDARGVDARIEAGLQFAGFRRYKNFVRDNGSIVGDYGNDGRRVTVTTSPVQPDLELFDPESQGTAYFVWKAE